MMTPELTVIVKKLKIQKSSCNVNILCEILNHYGVETFFVICFSRRKTHRGNNREQERDSARFFNFKF